MATTALPADAFTIIKAGSSVTSTWDIAAVHDLSPGGSYDIVASGALSAAADLDSDAVAAAIPYSSNTITALVDGPAAAAVRHAFHAAIARRTVVQSDCTGTRGTATRTALSNCAAHASAASAAAASGDAAKLTEYFKSATSATRSTVAGVFGRVASECGSTTGGVSRQYCSDVLSSCSGGVLAYTLPSGSLMVNCPLYFSGLPAQTGTCHAQDQATTTLHEVTHLTQIRGTGDFGCYGYNCLRGLSASQNLNHADTYSLFANGKFLNLGGDGGGRGRGEMMLTFAVVAIRLRC